jgi:adhesin transport system membrane fusion protein
MASFLSLQQIKRAYFARQVVWLVAALFLAILIWAAFSKLDEVVVAEGKVVPSQAVQKIQSLEGGIIREIRVQEGEQVKQGQILLLLDNTRFSSAFEETQQKMQYLSEREALLKALLSSVIVNKETDTAGITENIIGDWQDRVTLQQQSVQGKDYQQAYIETLSRLKNQLAQSGENILQQEKRLAEQQSRTLSLKARKRSIDKETQLISDMVDQGAVAEVEKLQLERQQIELQGEIDASLLLQQQFAAAFAQAKNERLNIALSLRADTQKELDDVEAELARLAKNQLAVADALERTELRSPMAGVVKQISARSLSGVVQPGEAIMEIVPSDDKLLVEAHVKPKDIAYLSLGQDAMVKFTAFDFVIYGGLAGRLGHISPDVLQKDDGSTYYKVYIETLEKSLDNRPLIPGMQASVDIMTGQKTVLNYWLKPLLRAKADALREH